MKTLAAVLTILWNYNLPQAGAATLITTANVAVMQRACLTCTPVFGGDSATGTANADAMFSGLDSTGQAHATASYGAVDVWGSAFGPTDMFVSGYASFGATASFTDKIAIYGGTGTGTLYWGVTETGCIDISRCSFYIGPWESGGYHPFTYGTPIDVSATAKVAADTFSHNGWGGASVTIVAAFEGGSAGLTYRTQSGTPFQLAGATFAGAIANPEPGTVWMLAGAVTAGWIGRKKLRH